MSRDFKSEYEEMLRADVPDIWDKIEAKIDEDDAGDVRIRRFRWQPYAGVAVAAVICLAIAVPVAWASRKAKDTMNVAQSLDAAVTDTYEATVETAETTEDAWDMDDAVEMATEAASESAEEEMRQSNGAGATVQAEGMTEEDSADEWTNADAQDRETAEDVPAESSAEEESAPAEFDDVSHDVILVVVADGTTEAQIEALTSKYHMTILYEYENLGNIYAFRLATPAADMAQLQELLEAIAREDGVLSAEPDYVMRVD